MTRRIVSIWLPRLGAERLLRRGGPLAGPFATVAQAQGALRLDSLSAAAEGAGLARGMGLADARAIRPDLITRPADPPAEAAFLGALLRWAGRYSPWVATDGAEGLALDVTGCAHLFGGEAALLEDALARLAAMGLSARAACADTRGAAWALARFAAGDGTPAGTRPDARPADAAPPNGARRSAPPPRGAPQNGAGRSGARESDARESGARESGVQRGAARESGGQESGARERGARESGVQRGAARESGGRESGAQESGARESGARESGAQESGARESGAQESGAQESGAQESGARVSGARENGAPESAARVSGAPPSAARLTGARPPAPSAPLSPSAQRRAEAGGADRGRPAEPAPGGDLRAAAGAPPTRPAPPARSPSGAPAGRDGDAIAADARATRVRSPARPSWEKRSIPTPMAAVVAPPGGARAAIGPLPVAALRLDPAAVEGLARLGLRMVADLAAQPRGALARRFGAATLRRLDQALGAEPEPVGAGRPAPVFAARLSLPEPVGRVADVAAALDRLLAQVTARLAEHGRGARRLRLSLRRVDRADLVVEVGLARPSRDAPMIAGLFARPVEGLDAGFGIEALRLEAVETEPLSPLQHRGHLAAGAEAAARAAPGGGEAFGALLSRLGGRIGFERLERFLPADSHIPARAFTVASAAFAPAHAGPWPPPPGPRPLVLFDPEPVDPEPPDAMPPPRAFRWRGRTHRIACAFGPERIAPEWWLDDPAWRTGPRDYWRVETEGGDRLWLFHAPLSQRTDRWFMEGAFG